jgi:methylenetetrahydrofolate dehydrogenase (NADP+) / methenyltetrahydrofolate cyclohydrolase
MKYLSGANLVDYISERQAKQIRALVQSKNIQPKLAIVNTNSGNLPSQKYIKYKQTRAEELGIQVELHDVDEASARELIQNLANDSTVHGIILQLPLIDPSQTDQLIKLIPPQKDVDGMTDNRLVEPATAQAVLWLLTGYGIDLIDKNILVIGRGRLVGEPLIKMLEQQNLKVHSLDITNTREEVSNAVNNADIIISATGEPGLIKTEMLKDKQVVIDAGTSEDGGELRGDLDPKVYESNLDIKVTPTTGGLGPLTISCLFENLLQLIDKDS